MGIEGQNQGGGLQNPGPVDDPTDQALAAKMKPVKNAYGQNGPAEKLGVQPVRKDPRGGCFFGRVNQVPKNSKPRPKSKKPRPGQKKPRDLKTDKVRNPFSQNP
jgi:hypothetical protein